MEQQQVKKERAVLAGLSAASMDEHERSTDVSMEELAALVETAGGEAVAMLIQNRPTPEPRSFIGDGKVQEMKQLIEMNDCDLAVFDNELSPSQMRVLSEDLGVKVLDRSGLILDIFAQRAQTKEGQLQVELAQYKYLLPRLTGMWTHLVRQTASGGSSPIGTRGPGETQLETDRRHIRRKIQKLEEELAAVRQVRATQRRRREKNAMPVVALVGYTNAGKSTLLNCLTGSEIPANDRLFDTLDTTTRRLRIDESTEVLLSDTVGFIRKLPTHLIEAFKATLEELSYADVLLHVIDISNPEWEEQARVVDELIRQLGAESTPCLRVYNKCDRYMGILPHGEDVVCISAKSGEGADALVRKLSQMLDRGKKQVTLLLPYSAGGLLDSLNREAKVLRTDYTDAGIEVEAVVQPELYGRVKQYIPGFTEPKEDWER
jgi:GTP-binding protein HflX